MSDRVENMIEKALGSEPTFKLREGFAEKVVSAIRKRELRNQRKLFVWMILGCLAMFGFGFMVMKAFMPDSIEVKNLFNFGDQFNQAIPLAVILGVVIVAIQYLDRKLVKEKYLFS